MTTTPGPPTPPFWYQKVGTNITLRRLSPVEYFRGLLGMTPAERERVLAGKSAAERKAVLAKIAEYEAMPVDVRDERLHRTEIHWQLMSLMRLSPEQRAASLRLISPLDQPMLLGALEEWDALPASLRDELLQKESSIIYYLQWQDARIDLLQNLSPARQQQWLERLRRWESLPEEKRARWSGEFRRFFAMSINEQQDAIQSLSGAERQQMDETWRTFARMPPMQRQICLHSFEKFATMSPDRQEEFLRNAQRWQSMSAHERQVWRQIVAESPPMPPLPPELQQRLPPNPPGLFIPGTNVARPRVE